MELSERAKRVVLSVIAVALNATVAVIERMLPFRPEWMERIELLAAEFTEVETAATTRSTRAGASRARSRAAPAETDPPDVEGLLAAFDVLWQFSQKTKLEGLLLDDAFCARVEKEWSTRTLLKFLQVSDESLKDKAGKAQIAARELMAGIGS